MVSTRVCGTLSSSSNLDRHPKMKKIVFIFISSFILDTIWQNLHVFLFANYKGGEITEFILLRAVLFDVLTILIFVLPFLFYSSFERHAWLIMPVGILFSIAIEWWGLGTGRWAYNSLMPIIPILNVGLAPTLQLGLIAYVCFRIEEKIFS